MQFVITSDGSPTIYDPAFGEHHHSLVGAYTEARYKFAEVARSSLEKKAQVNLLDLPFGLGYNLIATLDLELPVKIKCTAIELDERVIGAIKNCLFDRSLKKKFEILYPLSDGVRELGHDLFELKLLIGDLREVLPTLAPASFDLIYYDSFSPRASPELWSFDRVLKPLADLLTIDGLMITYTASPKVRKGLKEAGLYIAPGPAVGRKCPGTIAAKYDLNGCFETETLRKIDQAKPYP
ncbi:MAG: MnmC family methyltransferase [Candidatus Caenarcaniphilales bacterium]|nr:MnmC family methyltransferase [Candidatus Caenarcaniphilales bacterium]